MNEPPILPRWEPAWAQQHPWIWAIAFGSLQSVVIAGVVRYWAGARKDTAWIVGVVSGIVLIAMTRLFVTRTRRLTKRFTNPLFDVRRYPAWLNLAMLPIPVLILLNPINESVTDWNGWEMAWIGALIFLLAATDYWQYRWIRRIQSDASLMAYGKPTYYTHPPVPPPAADRPPPLPSSGDA